MSGTTLYVLVHSINGGIAGVITDLKAAERWKKSDPNFRIIIARTIDDKAFLASIRRF